MKQRKASPYSIHTDPRGRPVAVVEATQGVTFVLDADDWSYVRTHFGSTWRALTDGKGRTYIAAAREGTNTPLTLARAIMSAQPGEIVRYRDRNTLNLRRGNLYIDHGRSKHGVQGDGDRWSIQAA